MEIKTLTDLIVNNGIGVTVLIYFLVRDWKFQSTLEKTLITLVNTVETLKDTINKMED